MSQLAIDRCGVADETNPLSVKSSGRDEVVGAEQDVSCQHAVVSEVSGRKDFLRRASVPGAANLSGCVELEQLEPEGTIERLDPLGCLIREDDGPRMVRQPVRRPLLFGPIKSLFCVFGELHVIRRVGVHQVGGVESEVFEVQACEFPAGEDGLIPAKVLRVVDACVATKRNVEPAPRC